jgi:hypothetical protein
MYPQQSLQAWAMPAERVASSICLARGEVSTDRLHVRVGV